MTTKIVRICSQLSLRKGRKKIGFSDVATVVHAQLADSEPLKQQKTIRGSLEEVFELTKVLKCYMVLKS